MINPFRCSMCNEQGNKRCLKCGAKFCPKHVDCLDDCWLNIIRTGTPTWRIRNGPHT